MSTRTLPERLSHFALQSVSTPLGQVQFRQAGSVSAARTCVLLHGIGWVLPVGWRSSLLRSVTRKQRACWRGKHLAMVHRKLCPLHNLWRQTMRSVCGHG